MNMIRIAQYAGAWYPDEPQNLRSLVTNAILASEHRAKYQHGPYRFAVLPHAGLFYSKDGIAPFFADGLSGIENLLILSPSHYASLPMDVLASAPLSKCQTPLGNLETFHLKNEEDKWFSPIQNEHALEMVLPFIAVQKEKPKICLAMLSHFSEPKIIEKMANQLIEELGKENLLSGKTAIIASSDFTHYGPRFGYVPYGNRAEGRVKEDDLSLAHLLCDGRLDEAFAFCKEKRSTVCGYAVALLVASIAQKVQAQGWVANYYTSLDVASTADANFVAYSTILWR